MNRCISRTKVYSRLFVISLFCFVVLFLWHDRLAVAFPSDPDLKYFAGDDTADTAVSIEGEAFQVNGIFTYPGQVWNSSLIEGLLINSRMVNGVYDDMDGHPPSGMIPWDPLQNTQDFIAQMPNWKAQGLTAFTLNLQGGSNGCNGLVGDGQSSFVDNNPYGSEGTQAFDDWYANTDTPHARYLARLGSIIRAADDLGMVVVLGLFYFGQDESIANESAVIAAVDAVTDWILENKWTNVLVEINNEANIAYQHTLLTPTRVHELMQRVTTRSSGAVGAHLPHGRLLVSTSGGGGFIPPDEWIANSDFVLLHGNGQNSSNIRLMIDQAREKLSWQESPKPIVFNEDSTETSNFTAAVEKYASWGYFDDSGYQCVYNTLTADRWTLDKTSNPLYWILVEDITGVNEVTPPPGTIQIEAEEMGLAGYVIDPNNPAWIMVPASGSQGEAVGTFAGAEGEYQILLDVVAENDGQPTLELWVGGALQATFVYPLGSIAWERLTVSGPAVFLRPGDQIKLIGYRDPPEGGSAAHARVDRVRFELVVGNSEENQAPVVDAGADQVIVSPQDTLTVVGTATDDGLPNLPATVTYSWSQVGGPAGVVLGTPGTATTTVTFPSVGVYTLELVVSDSALTGSDTVVVTVEGTALLRVNAGGGRYTDSLGQVWAADTSFSGGRTFGVSQPISGTTEEALYQSERWGNPFGYAFPVPNDTYTVTLHFAEIFFSISGQRIFDVVAEGQPIVGDLDLFAQVGQFAAYSVTTDVTVTDGVLNLDFTSTVDNAKLSAVEVVGPAGDDPPIGTSVELEAEEMGLAGYVIDPNNPAWIMVPASGSQGEAVGTFSGPEGEYQVLLDIVAENDGQPTLELWVSGDLQATFVYPLGSIAWEPLTVSGPTILLRPGDQIKLIGYRDPPGSGSVAHARVDRVRFEPR